MVGHCPWCYLLARKFSVELSEEDWTYNDWPLCEYLGCNIPTLHFVIALTTQKYQSLKCQTSKWNARGRAHSFEGVERSPLLQ